MLLIDTSNRMFFWLYFNIKNNIYFIIINLQDLKEVLRDLIPKEQKRVAAFKAENKDKPLGQVTVDMVK